MFGAVMVIQGVLLLHFLLGAGDDPFGNTEGGFFGFNAASNVVTGLEGFFAVTGGE